MEDNQKDEPNTKINMIVNEKENHYVIIATYEEDMYLIPCKGESIVYDGWFVLNVIDPILKIFGIDTSLEKQIKDGTCIAIVRLKRDFESRQSRNKPNESLTKIALDYKNKCGVSKNENKT